MPDYPEYRKILEKNQPESFVTAGRRKVKEQQAVKDIKSAINEVKKTTKLGRPDTPLADTPEPRKYQ
jgi:hypothetical protein